MSILPYYLIHGYVQWAAYSCTWSDHKLSVWSEVTTQPFCLLLSPVAACSSSVEALAEAWSGVGAELGPGPGFRATDRGAGREALSGEGREAFRVAGGFMVLFELPGLMSGLPSVFTVLLFTQEVEPPWAAGRTTEKRRMTVIHFSQKELSEIQIWLQIYLYDCIFNYIPKAHLLIFVLEAWELS